MSSSLTRRQRRRFERDQALGWSFADDPEAEKQYLTRRLSWQERFVRLIVRSRCAL